MLQTLSYCFLSIGIALSGYFLGSGLQYFKTGQKRQVTVRGMATKLQTADILKVEIILWDSGNDVIQLRQKGLEWKKQTMQLVKAVGFKESEISEIPETINEIIHHSKSKDQTEKPIIEFKYDQKIKIVSDNLDLAEKIQEKMIELNRLNIKYNIELSYDFTQLDSIRPQMLAESLQSAQKAAQEFAKASGGRVGKIAQADQGRFTITSPSATNDYDYDERYSKIKKIRVISNIKYDLE